MPDRVHAYLVTANIDRALLKARIAIAL